MSKQRLCRGVLGACLALVAGAQAAWALSLQIIDPMTEQLLATEALSGHFQLGSLNMFGLRMGSHPRIDGIYPLNAQGMILAPDQPGVPPAMLYIIGANPNQAALSIEVQDLDTLQADLYAAYLGDLELYLSESQADWQPGTVLNGLQHVPIPNDNSLVPLKGIGGRLSDQPFQLGDSQLELDLALKVPVSETAGSKSGILTFTLVAQ